MGLIIDGMSPQDLILDGQSVSLYAGGNPPVKVWPTIKEVVQITLGTGLQAADQLRAALTARDLDPYTVTEIPFDIELVGTGSVQNMFQQYFALTSVPEMDTSQVTNMKDMFYSCVSLTSIPQMDTSSVTNMYSMFWGCDALTSVPDMDTGSVTTMQAMFQNCSSLTTVPWMDTSSVTTTQAMFSGCSELVSVPDMDTGSVTNMYFMFNGCSSLTYVPDMDTAQVTDMRLMLQDCSALTDGNVRLIGKHPSVRTTNMIHRSGLTREPFYDTDGNPI